MRVTRARRPRSRSHDRERTIRVEPIRTRSLLTLNSFDCDSLQAPDLIEPLIAFRRWRAVDGRLRSPYLPVLWDEPVMPARCHRQSVRSSDAVPAHTPPHAHCSCGIHAYHDPDFHFPTIDYRGVTGIVTLGGRVEVHPNGLRAEFARVEALGCYSRWSNRRRNEVQGIADQLRVDLVDLDELAEAAEEYGRRLLPRSLSRARAADRVTFSGHHPRRNSAPLAPVP